MKRALPIFLFVTGAALPHVFAQTSHEQAKRVIDGAVAALGGGRYLEMKDRVESGRAYSFYREQLSGLTRAKIYTRYLTRPEPPVAGFFGVREREAFGKDENSAILFTDDGGYEITFRGARPLPEETVNRFRESTLHNIFYILRQRLGEPGLIFDYRGSDIYDNQPVEILDITDADNRVTTVYFNQRTKLPVRQVYYHRDPTTRDKIEEETIFAKYRDVGGGVMWPFNIRRERNGEKIFEIYSDSVEVDQDLTDDLFTLPANMKILTKGKKK